MKKYLLMICMGLTLLVSGCFFERSNPASVATDSKSEVLPPAATAQVTIRLRLHNESLGASLRAQTVASAIFSLKLINRGNLSNPYVLMRKTAAIIDGAAAVSFQAVPAVPVIATLELENAAIIDGGTRYQSFHGGADLIPGQNNTVVIVASGSSEPEDVVAKAAGLAVADYTTMTGISAALFANLNEVYAAAAAADRLDFTKIFASYKNKIAASKIVAIAGGTTHSLALRDDGTLTGFGNNAFGQLALPDLAESLFPKFSPFTRRIIAMQAGEDYSLLLGENYKVYACGNNEFMQLGSNVGHSTAYPQEIPGLSNITTLAAGSRHALALDALGQLYVWGANDRGQLGLGNTSTLGVSAQAVVGMTGIKAIAAGSDYSLIVKSDGSTLWGTGDNSTLQLANENFEFTSTFVQISFPVGVGVSAVAAGGGHCLALGSDGKVYSWGLNALGQAGLATTTVIIAKPTLATGITGADHLYAGDNHSLVTSAAGGVYVFGDNYNGQLGLALTVNSRNYPELTAASGFSAVSSAGCGAANSYSVSAGKGYAVGDNSAGQIGNGLTDVTAGSEGVSTPAEIVISSPWS
ncbi:MAG TPA: hypothetical protein PLM07_01410 [Candidatus Rifleibacterium sp.]|nr:hypothetical protein [Candidatus Rifleibacterium sp.]HPT44535.1 hypothetical protein [Candidatus Rifleibacterium sp.]